MRKMRLVQIGLVVFFLVCLWIGLGKVDKKTAAPPLIRWVPAIEQEKDDKNRQEKTLPEQPLPVKKDKKKSPGESSEKGAAENTGKPASPDRPENNCSPRPPSTGSGKDGQKKADRKKKTWPDAGPQLFRKAPNVISSQLESFWGYQPNDLVYGELFENGSYEQEGELDALRAYLDVICKRLQPAGSQQVRKIRSALLNSDLDKWWFEKSEKSLERGVHALARAEQSMKDKDLRLEASPENLESLLDLYINLLEKEEKKLMQKEAGMTEVDNRFFHARGLARVCSLTLLDVDRSFRGASYFDDLKKDFVRARALLDKAAAMSPWMVMGGEQDELFSNHLLIMSYNLDQSRNRLEHARRLLNSLSTTGQ